MLASSASNKTLQGGNDSICHARPGGATLDDNPKASRRLADHHCLIARSSKNVSTDLCKDKHVCKDSVLCREGRPCRWSDHSHSEDWLKEASGHVPHLHLTIVVGSHNLCAVVPVAVQTLQAACPRRCRGDTAGVHGTQSFL